MCLNVIGRSREVEDVRKKGTSVPEMTPTA